MHFRTSATAAGLTAAMLLHGRLGRPSLRKFCEIGARSTRCLMPVANPWLAAVEPSPIGETKRWVLGRTFPADRPLIDLSQAVPGYPPAIELRRHLGELLLDPTMHGYTPILGLPALREDYAAHLSAFYGAPIAPGEVGITSGCNQAFCLALMSIARAGDEVILPRPHYFNHDMWMRMQGIEPVSLDFRPGSGAVPHAERRRAADRPTHPRHRADLAQQSDRRGLSARRPSMPSSSWRKSAASPCCSTRPTRTSCPRARGRTSCSASPDWRGTLVPSLQLLQGLRADRLPGRRRHRRRRPDGRDREGDGLRLDLPAAARPGSRALRPAHLLPWARHEHRRPEGARRTAGQRPGALQPLAAGQHRRLLRLRRASLRRRTLDRRVQAAGRRGEPAHHSRATCSAPARSASCAWPSPT